MSVPPQCIAEFWGLNQVGVLQKNAWAGADLLQDIVSDVDVNEPSPFRANNAMQVHATPSFAFRPRANLSKAAFRLGCYEQVWSKPEGVDESFAKKDLDKDLRLFSKANGDVLDLLLQTKRPGWILFGLSEMGSTKGTDLMLAYAHTAFEPEWWHR